MNGKLFDEREKAGTVLKSFYNKIEPGKELHIGTYQGFNLLLRKSILYESYDITIHGNQKCRASLGDSLHGNMVRIKNIVKNLEDRIIKSEKTIENHKRNLENSKLEYQKTFPYENEYKTKLARQFELNQELDLGMNNEEVIDECENEFEKESEYSVGVGR